MASEDAKKLVDKERAHARAVVESERAAVQRVEEALQEREQMYRDSGKQVMDIEDVLRAFRIQLAEKSKHSLLLQKKQGHPLLLIPHLQMERSPCCDEAHPNKGAWTKEEDNRLIAYIRSHGEGCWRSNPKSRRPPSLRQKLQAPLDQLLKTRLQTRQFYRRR
ncbi:hypothetical protein F3Y22_tig00117056pilonHSYRG01115 [Hibiscus syriacus]|uniref:Uncharacterized protein n=1 Tax=Hibiscus syriacus TaxID=106335 RepID=A0A6A2W9V5_HIBSY|nr:hypothetical protein F3Y22_tig00117056pilonHSYRG01115 [Hibiscus syriacus]